MAYSVYGQTGDYSTSTLPTATGDQLAWLDLQQYFSLDPQERIGYLSTLDQQLARSNASSNASWMTDADANYQFLDTDGQWKPVASDDPIYTKASELNSDMTAPSGWTWNGKDLTGQQYRAVDSEGNPITTSTGSGWFSLLAPVLDFLDKINTTAYYNQAFGGAGGADGGGSIGGDAGTGTTAV